MVNYGIIEDGRIALEDICEDGKLELGGGLTGDGRIILVFMVFSEDHGSGAESEIRNIFIWLALKLLQGKELNITLLQERGVYLRLTQEKKEINLDLSQVGGI